LAVTLTVVSQLGIHKVQQENLFFPFTICKENSLHAAESFLRS